MRDGIPKYLSQFLFLEDVAGVRVCACDAAFIDGVKGRDVVGCFLFSEEVNTHIFSDAVEPTVKRSIAPERLDRTKRFYPCFLCQVLCNFGIFDASKEMCINVGLVFDNKWVKGIDIAILGARDELFFVVSEQGHSFM